MVDVFTMNDGRKVSVDFADIKSVMKVSKKDWREINKWLLDAIEFINSSQYMINLKTSFGLKK